MLAVLLFAAVAASPSPSPVPPPQVPDAVTQHVLTLQGETIHYTARAGTITLYDDKNQPTNTMFFTAYTKDGADERNRPITFFYNGGPGGSSVWQRMAALGPVRVVVADPHRPQAAPYTLVDNQYSILNDTDEVYVDAPGTGFSRILPSGKAADVYGIDQDAQAFAQFIRRYLTQYQRWNSPKYLFGESYGTIRTAAVANLFESGFGQSALQLNGIVLMSSALNVDLLWDDETVGGNDWAFVLFLPTEAATAWYHHLIPNRPNDLHAFLDRVERFTVEQYLPALAEGDHLPAARRAAIVRQLHNYIGLPEQYISESNLRIPPTRFRGELLRSQRQSVGYMDTRYTAYDIDQQREAAPWDASDLAATPAAVAAFNDYLAKQLHYSTPLEYLSLIDNITQWNWKHRTDLGGTAALLQFPNTTADLAEVMVKNPSLRVFGAMGLYDMSTPYFQQIFDFRHLNLPGPLRSHLTLAEFEAGHMMYIDPASIKKLKADLDAWYAGGARAR